MIKFSLLIPCTDFYNDIYISFVLSITYFFVPCNTLSCIMYTVHSHVLCKLYKLGNISVFIVV